jgi:putative transposase
VLGISDKTYYALKKRPPSRRAQEDRRLTERIREVHAASYGAYGSRRVFRQLRRQGEQVGRARIERLMRTAGIRGQTPRTKRPWLTVQDPAAPKPQDLVERRFEASRPNQLWVCDLTYLKTHEGFAYLAFVKDVYSRKIVGWQLAEHLRTDLVLDALEMAVQLRRPAADLIHHSDRGAQYTSFRYTERLSELGIAASVGSVADAYDNAMAESFVASLKRELVKARTFASRFDAELAVVEYIGWFNHTRLHSQLDYLPPIEFENRHLHNHEESMGYCLAS